MFIITKVMMVLGGLAVLALLVEACVISFKEK